MPFSTVYRGRPLVVLLPLALPLQGADAQTPAVDPAILNLDFEYAEADGRTPAGWFTGGEGYVVRLDSSSAVSGALSLRIAHAGGTTFGVASRALPRSVVAGRTIRYSGHIRTEGIETGYAGL
jgi:erythromycin esterase